MSQSTVPIDPPDPVPHLAPEHSQQLKQYFETLLGKIIQTNVSSRYATESSLLATFRDSLPKIGKPHNGSVLVNDVPNGDTTTETENKSAAAGLDVFRTTVPLSDYDDYDPFIRELFSQPCKQSQVENLFAPGFPIFISPASMTTGLRIKYFPRYSYPLINPQEGSASATTKLGCLIMQLNTKGSILVVDDRNDTDGPANGEKVVTKIPICQVSVAMVRRTYKMGYDHDDVIMGIKAPHLTSPLGVSFIRNYRTALLMHGLFALRERALETIYTTFGTIYTDLLTFIEQEWDTLLLSIETGILPDFEDLEQVKPYLQRHFSPNKERAAELRSLESSKDAPGWLKKIWPDLIECTVILSGVYDAVSSKVRSAIGPDVKLRSTGYVLSECWAGISYKGINSYKLASDDYFEFLPVSLGADTQGEKDTFESLIPVWQLESGKTYEPVITSIHGLWRYRLWDVIRIEGFSPINGFPIINFVQRRQDELRLVSTFSHVGIRFTGTLLANAILSTTEDTIGRVLHFTSYMDVRPVVPSIGYIVELDGDIGPNPSQARYQVLESLKAQHEGLPSFVEDIYPTFLPTIRVVERGTFAEYRRWRVENADINIAQVKVPAVLTNESLLERLFARVMYEA